MIPLAITNILLNKEIPIYGDGLNIRDWLFVEDHCGAIDLVINKGIIGQKYCVGANNEIRNIDLINKICSLVDEYSIRYDLRLQNTKSSDLITFVPDRKGHDRRYAIDSSKIEIELNWKPKFTFDIGLKKTIDWYLKNKNWWEILIQK